MSIETVVANACDHNWLPLMLTWWCPQTIQITKSLLYLNLVSMVHYVLSSLRQGKTSIPCIRPKHFWLWYLFHIIIAFMWASFSIVLKTMLLVAEKIETVQKAKFCGVWGRLLLLKVDLLLPQHPLCNAGSEEYLDSDGWKSWPNFQCQNPNTFGSWLALHTTEVAGELYPSFLTYSSSSGTSLQVCFMYATFHVGQCTRPRK